MELLFPGKKRMRYYIPQIGIHTEARLQERNQSLAWEVWISSGKVSMINPMLKSWWNLMFCAPRWAAVFLLCNQAGWMESAVSWCWLYLLHHSLHMLTFTSNFVLMEGVPGSVLEALIVSKDKKDEWKYSKVNKIVHSWQLLLAYYGFVHVVLGTKFYKLW